MAIEIERKFRILNDEWKSSIVKSTPFRQGYLGTDKLSSTRIRISNNSAFLNIKSATLGIFRNEYEYEIPLSDATEMLANLCHKPLIEKTRYYVEHTEHTWEIDVFEGDNKGLIVAEIELQNEAEIFAKPSWIGAEVSHDQRYYNVCLVSHPYKDWTDK